MFKYQTTIKLTFMKFATKLLSIVLVLFFAACDKDDAKLDRNTLPGKWKLSESWASEGSGKQDWKPVKTQVLVQFKDDGSLAGNAFEGYVSYVIKDSKTLVLMKADKTEQNYSYTLTDGKLTLSPAGPIYCIEGCGSRYIKTK
jgi:hypothetical protein